MLGILPFVDLKKQPRKENFCDFLKFTCFPQFKWKSFIAIMSLIELAFFLATLILGGIDIEG